MIYTASNYYKSPDPCQAFKYQTWSLRFALISASFTFSTHSPLTTACCIDTPDTYLKEVNTMPSPNQFGHFTATAAFRSLIQQTCFMTAPNKQPLKSFSLIGVFCLFVWSVLWFISLTVFFLVQVPPSWQSRFPQCNGKDKMKYQGPWQLSLNGSTRGDWCWADVWLTITPEEVRKRWFAVGKTTLCHA